MPLVYATPAASAPPHTRSTAASAPPGLGRDGNDNEREMASARCSSSRPCRLVRARPAAAGRAGARQGRQHSRRELVPLCTGGARARRRGEGRAQVLRGRRAGGARAPAVVRASVDDGGGGDGGGGGNNNNNNVSTIESDNRGDGEAEGWPPWLPEALRVNLADVQTVLAAFFISLGFRCGAAAPDAGDAARTSHGDCVHARDADAARRPVRSSADSAGRSWRSRGSSRRSRCIPRSTLGTASSRRRCAARGEEGGDAPPPAGNPC